MILFVMAPSLNAMLATCPKGAECTCIYQVPVDQIDARLLARRAGLPDVLFVDDVPVAFMGPELTEAQQATFESGLNELLAAAQVASQETPSVEDVVALAKTAFGDKVRSSKELVEAFKAEAAAWHAARATEQTTASSDMVDLTGDDVAEDLYDTVADYVAVSAAAHAVHTERVAELA
jgi:hypothetical protein